MIARTYCVDPPFLRSKLRCIFIQLHLLVLIFAMDSRYYSFEPQVGGDPNLRVSYYDPNQLINESRILGPQGYADAVAFWYRPDHSDPMFEGQSAGQARHAVAGAAEHVKHRRTRSGCYTCRSRRVKVKLIVILYYMSRLTLSQVRREATNMCQ